MHFECKIRQKFDNKDQKTLSSFNVLHQAVRVVCETREVLLTTGTGYLYLPEWCMLLLQSSAAQSGRVTQDLSQNFRASRDKKKNHIFARPAKKKIFHASREKNPKNLPGFNRNFQGGVSH